MGECRGGGGECPDPPLKNHKNIGCLSNTDPDLLDKATKPAFNIGPPSTASETPLKLRLAGKTMMTRFSWYLDLHSPHQLKKSFQSWNPSDKPFRIRAWLLFIYNNILSDIILDILNQLQYTTPFMVSIFLQTLKLNQCHAKMISKGKLTFETVHVISNNVVCATSKAPNQPAHTRSLIRAFACRLKIL